MAVRLAFPITKISSVIVLKQSNFLCISKSCQYAKLPRLKLKEIHESLVPHVIHVHCLVSLPQYRAIKWRLNICSRITKSRWFMRCEIWTITLYITAPRSIIDSKSSRYDLSSRRYRLNKKYKQFNNYNLFI